MSKRKNQNLTKTTSSFKLSYPSNESSITLSNTIVKAYAKKNNQISIHLKSDLLIQSNKYFSSEHLKQLSGKIILPSNNEIIFDKGKFIVSETDFDYNFDGTIKVISFQLTSVINYQKLNSSTISIALLFEFDNFSIPKRAIKTVGLLRKMYDERQERYSNLVAPN